MPDETTLIQSLDELELPPVDEMEESIEYVPWERMVDEPDLWFDRFNRFRRSGPVRSIHQIYVEERQTNVKAAGKVVAPIRGGTPGVWQLMSKRWDWNGRARAWDAFLAARDEAIWLQRRDELRGKEWEVSAALIKKAEEMLKFPLATVVKHVNTETGDATTEVRPARWDFNTVSTYLEMASKISRLAAEMKAATEPTTLINQTTNVIRVRELVVQAPIPLAPGAGAMREINSPAAQIDAPADERALPAEVAISE